MKIAIIGGTGAEGAGLGFRWAAAGHNVIIGSRSAERGHSAALEMLERLPAGSTVTGTDNASATQQGEIIVLSVPYEAQHATLDQILPELDGKRLLLTVVAPTRSPKARVWRLDSGLSAAEEAQQQVGEQLPVVAAFQNIGAHHLGDLDHVIDCDVLICGDKKADKEIVETLVADAGMRGINAGALTNASVVEGMTALLIGINIRHKIGDAGIRITGLPQ